MFHEVEGNSTGGSAEIQSEPPAASAEGAALGSAAPGSTLSHDQFWSPVVLQPEIRRQDPEQDIQSLFHIIIRAESQVDGSTKTELNALGAHDVTEIFHHFTTKIHREVQSIRITFWICSWLGDRLGPDGQNTSKMILDDEDPYLTTGSPPCDPLSILQGLSQGRMDPEKFQARLKEGKEMLETSCSIYKQRIKRSISYMNIRSQQSRGKKRPVRGRMWRS